MVNMNYGYIGPTPITEYGCVLCQKYHRLGIDQEYEKHIYHQSKHGTSTREPRDTLEKFVAHFLASNGGKIAFTFDFPKE